MSFTKLRSSTTRQLIISIGLVSLVSLILFFFANWLGYRVVAFLLLMVVSLLAMLFDILPVVLAAICSALIWNFFFIPPIFTFHIERAEDILLFMMYFIVALVHGVLTFKIREAEKIEREKLEKENTIRLYNTLLSSLSHELRTPIATIIAAVDILNGQKRNLPAKVSDLLVEIDSASMRLNRQVENLLNMSRLETGMLKLRLEWTDLNELVYKLVDQFHQLPTRHIIQYAPSEEQPLFKLDASLIEEVLNNLLHNAVLHTPEGSVVSITTSVVDECCQITIQDNGGGFPESAIPSVFDKFYRLPTSTKGGTGLGLSIVKGFIEAHKGTISLVNNGQGGATFTISIPCPISYLNNLKHE